MTTKELKCIEELLDFELNLIKKYRFYTNLCKDPQLKINLETFASKHQENFTKLLNQLN